MLGAPQAQKGLKPKHDVYGHTLQLYIYSVKLRRPAARPGGTAAQGRSSVSTPTGRVVSTPNRVVHVTNQKAPKC